MPIARPTPEIEIYYETVGDGPSLLLISGTGHDLTFWSGQLDLLSTRYRCIVFDNRGVGRSSSPDPGYSLGDMAGDAAAVVAAAGVERVHVMGFSMGGHIAQELALRHPDTVASLAVHHSWATNCPRLASFQAARKALAEHGLREALADISLVCLFEPNYFHNHLYEMAERRRAMIDAMGDLKGWIGQLEACLKGDTGGRLSAIDVPVLITCSDRDAIVAVHRAEEIHRDIKNSRLDVLEGTGHVALIERPEEFALLCLDFLDSLPKRRVE